MVISIVFTPMLRSDGTINRIFEAVGLPSLSQAWLTNPAIVIWTVAFVSIWQHTGFPNGDLPGRTPVDLQRIL
ncbi:hypothetical protein ACFSQ7_16300 [Paenibacillus rhizoplanae]